MRLILMEQVTYGLNPPRWWKIWYIIHSKNIFRRGLFFGVHPVKICKAHHTVCNPQPRMYDDVYTLQMIPACCRPQYQNWKTVNRCCSRIYGSHRSGSYWLL